MAVDEQEKPRKWNEWVTESPFSEVREWQEWGWITRDDILEMFFYTPEYVAWLYGPRTNDEGAPF